MSATITIGKNKYSYNNNGCFITIYGYSHEDGNLVFTEESDGKSYFHIHIPETIEDLPVLVVEKLYLDIDIRKYRHNGRDEVKIHLPQYATFFGLKEVSASKYSVLVPNYSEEFYPRKQTILLKTVGIYNFFARPTNGENTCNIICITENSETEKDWVWSPVQENDPTVPKGTMLIPAEINGYAVKNIAPSCDFVFKKTVKKIEFEDGIETIGDKCFFNYPALKQIYLPKTLKQIGEAVFGFYVDDEYVPDVLRLTVYYYEKMPTLGKDAFHRYAKKRIYEDYADWGNMYAGSEMLSFEVEYIKQN